MASSSQELHIRSKFALIVLIMPHRTFIGIRHEALAHAHECMRQSVIAGCVGLTHATLNCILQRHAATGILVPGKSMGGPQKTTPRQDNVLFRMVQQDRFMHARALMVQIRNLYGMRAGQKTTGSCPWLLCV